LGVPELPPEREEVLVDGALAGALRPGRRFLGAASGQDERKNKQDSSELSEKYRS